MDRIIYCFWTGSNDMSHQRKECLGQLKTVTECKVICLFNDDIPKYILPEYPLHPGYEYLSETHKADYLRTYFMNFYGGGYADIKRQSGSWIKSFDLLEQSDKWIIGYGEYDECCIAGPPAITKQWRDLIGNGAYICKPQTPLTQEWYSEMLKLLDERLSLLQKFPSTFPQDHSEISNGKYSIGWNEMLGRIFHRVSCNYKDKLLNTLPMPDFGNYR
jgi:hypothetical protein